MPDSNGKLDKIAQEIKDIITAEEVVISSVAEIVIKEKTLST